MAGGELFGVTGAAGQFGLLAAEALLHLVEPERIVLISRTPENLSRFAALGVQMRFGDFDRADTLPQAFDGISSLLLISTSALGRRVVQHEGAIRAARAAGVRRIAYTSFLAADSGNPALVGRDHQATETILRGSGLQWTILRNAQYADAILDVILPGALAVGEWRSSSGEGRIAVISRAECAACAAAALVRPDAEDKIHAITGPELLRFQDMAAMASEAYSAPLRYVQVDDAGLYAMFDALGAPRAPSDVTPGGFPWCSDDMVSFEAALRDGWFEILSDDACDLLGRPPRGFADLLKDRIRANTENAAI